MKKVLLGLAAASALTASALPAAAAPQMGVNARQAQIEHRISVGLRQDRLTQREASQLRIQLRRIAAVEQDYRSNGLNVRERADLTQRLDRLEWRVTAELNDRNGYAQGYGRQR
jgi:Spy/CpxP family protein refolding chaperone